MKNLYEAPEASLIRFSPMDALANGIADGETTEPDEVLSFGDMFN